jgi:hypothetical protein
VNIRKLIDYRIINLNQEKDDLLELYKCSSYEEEYITKRICYITERIRELQDLIDTIDVLYGGINEEDEKEN